MLVHTIRCEDEYITLFNNQRLIIVCPGVLQEKELCFLENVSEFEIHFFWAIKDTCVLNSCIKILISYISY